MKGSFIHVFPVHLMIRLFSEFDVITLGDSPEQSQSTESLTASPNRTPTQPQSADDMDLDDADNQLTGDDMDVDDLDDVLVGKFFSPYLVYSYWCGIFGFLGSPLSSFLYV